MNGKGIYYSCNNWLSYQICQRYYGQRHYAWCAPYFDARSKLSSHNSVPPSSNPHDIYWSLRRDVDGRDRHSIKVAEIRRGIQKGAALNLKAGNIDTMQYREILDIVKQSQLQDFAPLMFVIPHHNVATLLACVPVKLRAHPLSEEYIIRSLPRDLFDAFEL
jgi:hypothetical protein